MSDIVIGAVAITGFNNASIGADTNLSGLSVTLDSPTVTGSNILRPQWVGMGGFKVQLNGVEYTVASVESRDQFTLTENYAGMTGTVTGIWRKYAQLRIYALQSFVPSGSVEVVQEGAPNSNDWYRRYAAPVIHDGEQNIMYLPEVTLPATTNSSSPMARYFAGIYGPSGNFLYQAPIVEFRLDATTTPTSWAQIRQFNSPANPAPPQPTNYYTSQQIDARFPSGLADQLLYFEETGNVLSPLTLGPDLQITAGVLEFAGPGGINRLQEEGSNLPQQTTLNFIGSAFTAADDPGNNRTNLSADSDLNAIASNSTNGIYARTGSGTVAARTITGPAAGITVTNGDGVSGNPTFALANDLAALEGLGSTGIAARTGSDAWAQRTITGTANRIGVTNGDGVSGNPTLDIGSDVVTLTGSQTLTNKTLTSPTINTPTVSGGTFTSPRVVTSILDSNGNELALLTATGSAVNEITLANAAAGGTPSITASGDDTNIGLQIASKGTDPVDLVSNGVVSARVQPNGTFQILAGDGTTGTYKRAIGSLFSDPAARNNTGTSEHTFADYTLAANVLGTVGDAVIYEAEYVILPPASGDNFIRFRFGGTQIFQSTVTNTGLHFRVVIWRRSSDTVFYSTTATYDSSVVHGRGTIGSLSFAGTLTMSSRGISTADGSNELTQNSALIYKFDNP